MNWTLAIDRNRDALLKMAAMLFTMIGLAQRGSGAVLPKQLHRSVLRILRPAESATRRLIVVVARGLSGVAHRARSAPTALFPQGGDARVPCFALFDPRKRRAAPRSAGPGPRLSIPGVCDPVFADTHLPPTVGGADSTRVCNRLQALQAALNDLPRQAQRLARWREKRRLASSGRFSSLRPGRPPGYRAKPVHEVDDILNDCHGLARHVMQPPDTS